MSRKRSSKKQISDKVRIFKILDPVVQSILFIKFAFDVDAGTHYLVIFFILGGWQMMSLFVNFFFKKAKLLTTERISYLVVFILFLPAYFLIKKHLPERTLDIMGGHGLIKLPIVQITSVSIGIAIEFWYYVICFREIKKILKEIGEIAQKPV